MASAPLDYQFITGTPNASLAQRLALLHADGWLVTHVTGDAQQVVALLQRVSGSAEAVDIRTAIEELPEPIDDATIPSEELL